VTTLPWSSVASRVVRDTVNRSSDASRVGQCTPQRDRVHQITLASARRACHISTASRPVRRRTTTSHTPSRRPQAEAVPQPRQRRRRQRRLRQRRQCLRRTHWRQWCRRRLRHRLRQRLRQCVRPPLRLLRLRLLRLRLLRCRCAAVVWLSHLARPRQPTSTDWMTPPLVFMLASPPLPPSALTPVFALPLRTLPYWRRARGAGGRGGGTRRSGSLETGPRGPHHRTPRRHARDLFSFHAVSRRPHPTVWSG
jgi:hypothetical protein